MVFFFLMRNILGVFQSCRINGGGITQHVVLPRVPIPGILDPNQSPSSRML